jgi:hypothetical protein
MNINIFKDSPLKRSFPFKLIESLEEIALSNIDYRSNYAKAVLKEIAPVAEFRNGIENLSTIENNKHL